MPKCPNCFYELVLLEYRRRYKCAKCGRVYLQHDTELKEFVEFNKRQRKLDEEALTEKRLKQLELKNFQKEQKQIQKTEERSIKYKQHYEINKDSILIKQRAYRRLNRQKIKEQGRNRYRLNIEEKRQFSRIKFWRAEQKLLAVRILENGLNNAYNPQFQEFLPTISLS